MPDLLLNGFAEDPLLNGVICILNEKRKSVAPPNPSTDCMFFAGTSGRLLLRSDDRIMLFEPQSRRVLAELQVARIKYVIWNQDCSHVALISKHGIHEHICKSAADDVHI